MPLLALDTSGPSLYLALRKGSEVFQKRCDQKNSHNEKLSSLYSELLASANITSREISSITVGEGPGSFTGLRIGLSFAKGLSHALKIPLKMGSSFTAAAWSQRNAGKLIVTISDARRSEYFSAVHKSDGVSVEELLSPGILTADQLRVSVEDLRKRHEISSAETAVVQLHGELAHPLEGVSIIPGCLGTALLELEGSDVESYRVSSISLAAPSYIRAVAALSIAEREKLKVEKKGAEVTEKVMEVPM